MKVIDDLMPPRAKATVRAKVIGAPTRHRVKVIVHVRVTVPAMAIVRARADKPRGVASVAADSVPDSARLDLVPADSAPVAADLAVRDLVLVLGLRVEIGQELVPMRAGAAATVHPGPKGTVPAKSASGRVTTTVLAAKTASGVARTKHSHSV